LLEAGVPVLVEQLIDLVEAFGAVHEISWLKW